MIGDDDAFGALIERRFRVLTVATPLMTIGASRPRRIVSIRFQFGFADGSTARQITLQPAASARSIWLRASPSAYDGKPQRRLRLRGESRRSARSIGC